MTSDTTFAEFRRGWRVLLASSVGTGSGITGLPFYTFGVFVVPLVAAMGWTRGQVARGASCLLVGTVITAPIVGWMIDRYGARRVGILSMLALALGYALLTQLSGTVTNFYLAWGAIALAAGGTTPVVWTRAVSLWFDRWRGLALGIALAGSGLAGVLAPVLANRAIEAFGWRGAYLALGGFILVFAAPILVLLFRDRRQVAAAGVALQASGISASLPGLTLHEALRTVVFWRIAFGFLFVSSVVSVLILNLVPLLIDRGMTAATAARVASVLGLAVLFGRIGIGYLLDRFSAPIVAGVLFGLSAAGALVLSVEDLPGWTVRLAVISIGLSAAAEFDLVSYLTGRFLGMRAYGRIYGWQLSIFFFGAAAGPFAAGFAYDHFHSYVATLEFAAGALIIAALVLGTLGRPPSFAGDAGIVSPSEAPLHD
jgi:MFS family permease